METPSDRSVIEELRSVRRQVVFWRVSLGIVLAVVVVVCVFQFFNAAHGLVREGAPRDRFVQVLGTRMQDEVLPQVQEVGKEAFTSINFPQEIDRLNQRAPEVADTALKEMRLLATNLPESGKKVVSKEFENALADRAEALQKEFPDYSEEQIKSFLDELNKETQDQLGILMDSLFTGHIDALNGIVASIDDIAAQTPAAKTDIPTWQMALLILDIARADFTLDAAQAPATPAAATAPAGKGRTK